MGIVWLCEDDVGPGDDRWLQGSVARDGICARCGGLAMLVYDSQVQEPRPSGSGWHSFTTSVDLVPYRPWIWDTNLYYRDLGVSPYATRREIREAYQQREGWDSERLTHIVKQLLDEEVRARYDATPLGAVFFDRYFAEMVLKRIAQSVAEANLNGGSLEDFDPNTVLDMVNQRSFGVVDAEVFDGQDVSAQRQTRMWAYWRWASAVEDPEKMGQWQELLIQAFSERKERRNIAVGIHRISRDPVRILEVGDLTVVFLHDKQQPTSVLAEQAAGRVVQSIPSQQEAVFA